MSEPKHREELPLIENIQTLRLKCVLGPVCITMLVIHCTSWQEAATEHTALLLHPSELQEYNFVCITAALLVTFATPGMKHEAKRCYLLAQKSAQKQGHSADVRRCCAEMVIAQLLVRGVCVENKRQPWLHSVRSLL